MKELMIFLKYVLVVFLPLGIFIWVSPWINFDIASLIPFLSIMTALLLKEVVASEQETQFIAAVVVKSFKDKFIFAFGLFLFGCLSAFPKFLGYENPWISLCLGLLGGFAMLLIIKAFGSEELKRKVMKPIAILTE